MYKWRLSEEGQSVEAVMRLGAVVSLISTWSLLTSCDSQHNSTKLQPEQKCKCQQSGFHTSNLLSEVKHWIKLAY